MTNGGDTGTRGRTSKQHGNMNTIDINNNPQVTWGRTDLYRETNWRHLGHNQDTRLTLTELIMTGKQEGPYKGEETKAEEDKL